MRDCMAHHSPNQLDSRLAPSTAVSGGCRAPIGYASGFERVTHGGLGRVVVARRVPSSVECLLCCHLLFCNDNL